MNNLRPPYSFSNEGTSEGALKAWETRRVGGVEFVSPNVRENTKFAYAKRELGGESQKRLKEFSDRVDTALGIKQTQVDAIGDWKDGAENTVVTVCHSVPNAEAVRASAALKGLAARQKQVIPFVSDPKGKDYVHEFTLPVDASKSRGILDKHGLQFRTLIPQGDKTKVMIFDPEGSVGVNVHKITKEYGIKHIYHRGTGEFLGGNTREEGAAAYRKAIERYELAAGGGGPHRRVASRDISSLIFQAEKGIGRHPAFANDYTFSNGSLEGVMKAWESRRGKSPAQRKTDDAYQASRDAWKSGKPEDHEKAVNAHNEAAKMYRDEDDLITSSMHERMALEHQKVASYLKGVK